MSLGQQVIEAALEAAGVVVAVKEGRTHTHSPGRMT